MSFNFESLWGEAEEAQGSNQKEFEPIEDGTYICKISKTEFDITKETPKAIIVFDIESAEADPSTKFKGRKLWANYQMSPQGISYFKRDLTRLGVDHSSIKTIDDLATNLGLIEGKTAEVYVKNKPSTKDPSKIFTSTYINGLVDTELGF
jgi:hypothetical protein